MTDGTIYFLAAVLIVVAATAIATCTPRMTDRSVYFSTVVLLSLMVWGASWIAIPQQLLQPHFCGFASRSPKAGVCAFVG